MSPSRKELARTEAAEWLFRLELGLSVDDERALRAWITASPDHGEALTEAKAILDQIGSEDDPLIDAMRADALSARPVRSPGVRWAAMTAAAVVVLALIGVVTLRLFSAPHGGTSPQVAIIEPAYATGERSQTLTLADGSPVVLDPRSALSVRYTTARRDLRLTRGRALFEVQHDGRPFAVEAGGATVTATGTRFSVALMADGAIVALERGQVIVTRAGDIQRITLTPGQTLVALRGKPMSVKKTSLPSTSLHGHAFIELHDTPLATAAAKISEGASPAIHVIGKANSLKISGRFRLGDPAGFAAAVVHILPVRQRPSRGGGIDLVSE